MQHIKCLTALGAALFLTTACTDDNNAPSAPPSTFSAEVGATDASVSIMDACDPATFNAALGPGTCVGNGTVTFNAFIAELRSTRKVATWANAPLEVRMLAGQTLTATNIGGEAHTFTEVAKFGGGIVPSLNDLMRVKGVAPECQALAPEDFLAPGAVFTEVENDVGVEKYQCCIHPWMKAWVIIK